MVIAGATFDADYLKHRFLPQMLDALIAYKLGEDGGIPLAMVVYTGDPDADAGAVDGHAKGRSPPRPGGPKVSPRYRVISTMSSAG